MSRHAKVETKIFEFEVWSEQSGDPTLLYWEPFEAETQMQADSYGESAAIRWGVYRESYYSWIVKESKAKTLNEALSLL